MTDDPIAHTTKNLDQQFSAFMNHAFSVVARLSAEC